MRNFHKAKLAVLLLGLTAFTAPAAAQVAVVNAAGFQANAPVAPGSIASAFGTFTGAAFAASDAVPLPTTLGGAQLLVDGAATPLFFASAGQINFQTPAGLTAGRHQVSVTVNGSEVAAGFVDVSGSYPGIFILDPASVDLPGAVLNQDGSVNGPDNPAARGSVVVIFGTGQGPVDNAVADGTATPADTLSTSTLSTRAWFAGIEGAVAFSGLAPNFVGLWQINTVVPANSVTGKVPLFVTIGETPAGAVSSNHVSIWVSE